MNPETANYLLELNRQFYQTFASQFSATRRRIQPGVQRLLERIPSGAVLLDLGCGNGELWRVLHKKGSIHRYIGVDFSPPLLGFANASQTPQAVFVQADLSDANWIMRIPEIKFDAIFAFAVLHHLPGHTLQLRVLQQVRELLTPGGYFFHSEWQFLNSPKLKARVQPWEMVGLSADQVDAGDFLMDWRFGGTGLRYLHHFEQAELKQLALQSHFGITDTFYSDGENGKLSIYQVWESQG